MSAEERRAESSRPTSRAYTADEYRKDDWGWRWARGLQENEEEARRRERAKKIARRNRWAFPGKVRVVHPKYGEVIVPGASKFAAILCAAEKWKCDWAEITDAEVWALDNPSVGPRPTAPLAQGSLEKDKKEQPALAGADCEG